MTSLPAPDGPRTKLGEQVAKDIERRILGLGWPVGQVLGSEAQLIAEYGVSRAVLREAIRLLEHDHIATMRRGPGGGLIVTPPDHAAVVRSVALELGYQDVSAQNLFDVRVALEATAVRVATATIDEAGIAELREALEVERETYTDRVDQGVHSLHLAIADRSGNPALRLFLEILTRLTHASNDQLLVVAPETSVPQSEAHVSEVHRAHEAIVEAIVMGDEGLAQHRMLRHLDALRQWINQEGGPALRR